MQQAQLDAAARQMGFKSYAEYSAWSARQREMRGQNGTGLGGTAAAPVPRPKPQPQPQRNWLQQLLWGLGGGQ